VHVVIIGFASYDRSDKTLFEYANSKAEPVRTNVSRINPYLADAVDVLLFKRSKPICGVPEINYGSMANDRQKGDKGLGNLILDREAKRAILDETPDFEPFIRPFIGSEEFLNSTKRWCLWLIDAPPELILRSKLVSKRIAAVREARLNSGRSETVKLASTPSLFGENRQPTKSYLLLPKVSSEERIYVPLGFLGSRYIANGSSLIIPNAGSYEFGVLSSTIHLAWMRYTGGRLESRYQYSSQIVYNNFPWPQNPTVAQKEAVERAAQKVLDTRTHFSNSTLAVLYSPVTMPPTLFKAHAELDRAVDRCYRKEPFSNDRERVEYLFQLYEKLAAPLLPTPPKRHTRKAL
jgi:hypothetical protein